MKRQEIKKVPILDTKEESANLAHLISSLAEKLLAQIRPKYTNGDLFSIFYDTTLPFTYDNVMGYVRDFNTDPVGLILKINDEMLQLQKKKFSNSPVIESFRKFSEDAYQIYLKIYSSKILALYEEYKSYPENVEISKQKGTLLSEAIRLSALDCAYSEELISLMFEQFKDIRSVYIDKDKALYFGNVPSIFYAANLQLFDIILHLAKLGADPNELYANDETFLHHYVDKGIFSPEHMDIFHNSGADFNIRSQYVNLTPVEKSILLDRPINQYFISLKKEFFLNGNQK